MKRFSSTFWILLLLLSMVAFAPQAQATSYDPAQAFQPVYNQGQIGDALLGSFYRTTVGDANFLTYVSIENTTNKYVAAHVRLRSGRYSIEVLDFPILLSPHDVFYFQFEATGTSNGNLTKLILWTTDEKTVQLSGLSKLTPGWRYVTSPFPRYEVQLRGDLLAQFDKLDYPLDDPATLEEMTMGHVEVFGLWQTDLPFNPYTSSITFLELMNKFYASANARVTSATPITASFGTLGTAVAEDVGKSLAGHVFNGDFSNGIYTGFTMDAIKNFRTGSTVNGAYLTNSTALIPHRDMAARGALADSGVIVYNATSAGISTDAAYTEPDWATSFGPTWNDGDSYFTDFLSSPALPWQTWSIDDVDDALAKQKITSTYFNAGFATQTFSTAIVTFPTKYLHVFFNKASGLPQIAGNDAYGWPVAGLATAPALPPQSVSVQDVRAQIDVEAKAGTVRFGGQIWDMAECTPGFQVSPFAFDPFYWEVNCLPLGASSKAQATVAGFCNLLTFPNRTPFDVTPGPDTYAPGCDFFAGKFVIQDFTLNAGLSGDPRNNDATYARDIASLLLVLQNTDSSLGGTLTELIPAIAHVIDWDFTNFPHARDYQPSWDNPGGSFLLPGGIASQSLFPFNP